MYGIRTLLLATVTSLLAWPSALSAKDTCYDIEKVNVPGPYGVDRSTSWTGVNNSGLVSGNFCVYEGCDPFVIGGALYDTHQDAVETFQVPGYAMTFPGKLNNMGEVAIQACNPRSDAAYDWMCRPYVRNASGAFIPLERPRSVWTAGSSIDDERRVGGQFWDNTRGYLGIVWDEDGWQVIDMFPGYQTFIGEVLNDGTIVGSVVSLDWTEAWGFEIGDNGMSWIIPPEDNPLFFVDGGNNRGQKVGRELSTGVERAYVLYRGELTPLDIEGAYNSQAADINEHGVIVGTYNDYSWGFVARPVTCEK